MASPEDVIEVLSTPSGMEDPQKEDCLLEHMEITIAESEKRTNPALNIREFYTVYLIETKVTDEDWPRVPKHNHLSLVWRRYSEFEQLKHYLHSTYPYVIVPPLPEKRPSLVWRPDAETSSTDIMDPDFVDRRRVSLENFLHRVSSHPVLCYDSLFLSFLRQESGWRETLQQAIGPSNSHVGTNTLLASSRYFISNSQQQGSSCKVKYPNRHMEKMRVYADNLDKSLNAVLRVRCRLAEKLYTIHRLHENYGKVLCEWAAIEQEMGDGLQRAGHYFDSLAEFIRPALEEEDLIADQLKEVWQCAGSLAAVSSGYTRRQADAETWHRLLADKQHEKAKLEQGAETSSGGGGNFLMRILGATSPSALDSRESRDVKLATINARLREIEIGKSLAETRRDEFLSLARVESERFTAIMAEDVRDSLRAYVRLQIRMQRKCLSSWTHIRHCVQSIP